MISPKEKERRRPGIQRVHGDDEEDKINPLFVFY